MSKSQDVSTAIRERSDVFEQHFRQGDAGALVADYYVADAEIPMLSMPDAPLIKGAAGIEQAFAGIMTAFSDCRLEAMEIQTDGDMAHELGRCDITGNDGTMATARYSILWRRTGAGWRVQSDFFAFGDLR